MPARLYRWDEWFREHRFTLRRGTDYTTTTSAMIQQIRNAASRRHLSIEIEDRGTEIIVSVQKAPSANGTT